MELENQSAKQAYIRMMVDSLRKKSEILKKLIELTRQQERIIASDNIDDKQFLQMISLKEEQINDLTKLDNGFDQLFRSVKEEISVNKEKYAYEIMELKELIVEITNMNVELQAAEKRNKSRMEAYFSKKRKEIRSGKISSSTVTSYYKTMAQQHEAQSYFFDKKN